MASSKVLRISIITSLGMLAALLAVPSRARADFTVGGIEVRGTLDGNPWSYRDPSVPAECSADGDYVYHYHINNLSNPSAPTYCGGPGGIQGYEFDYGNPITYFDREVGDIHLSFQSNKNPLVMYVNTTPSPFQTLAPGPIKPKVTFTLNFISVLAPTLDPPTPYCNGSVPQIGLSWSGGFGAISYDVYRNGVFYQAVGLVNSFTDDNVVSGTSYDYFVRAISATGSEADSNTASATALSCPGGGNPPAAPDNLALDNSVCGRVRLTWNDNSTDEDGFRIYRSAQLSPPPTFPGDYTVIVPLTAANATSDDDFPPTGASYHYAVTAVLGAFESTPATEGPVFNDACGPNLSGSQKIIHRVNGDIYSGQTIKNGDTITFRIVVSNSPPQATGPAYDVYMVDTLSANLDYVPGSAVLSGPGTSLNGERIVGQTITWDWPGQNLGDKAADNNNWLLNFDAIVNSSATQPIDFFRNDSRIFYALSNGGPQTSQYLVRLSLTPFRTGLIRTPTIIEGPP